MPAAAPPPSPAFQGPPPAAPRDGPPVASDLLGPGEEQALLGGLRAGDEGAYERLIRAFGGRMLAAARRILPTEEDAEDAVQEAFLSAFRKLETFQGQARLGTWLHRIAINAALMKLRSLRRRQEQDIEGLLPKFTGGGHFQETPRAWADAPEEVIMREELRGRVSEAIASLPENYRIPLVLRDIEGLDNEALADELGVSVNAAKIRVHRARLALKALLDPVMNEARP